MAIDPKLVTHVFLRPGPERGCLSRSSSEATECLKDLATTPFAVMLRLGQPREKRVKQALLILNDPSLRPIFIHCLLGQDRNTFIVGLYRVYFQDWTPQAAWQEMLRSGFHSQPRLRGFTTYFWRHTQKPNWVERARAAPEKETP